MLRALSIALVPKFLLVFVPTFLVLAGLSFATLLRYDERWATDQLALRIGNQSARAALAVVRHGALGQKALLRDLLAPLTADRAVDCIDLRTDGDGGAPAGAATGLECGAHERPASLFDLPLGDEHGTTLSVRFNDDEVREEALLRRRILFSSLVISALLATASAFLAFRLVVGKRMANLATALRRIAEGGQREPVATGSTDELGQVMGAFNNMIRHEAEREKELQASLDERETARAELERLNGELEHWIQTGESERRFRDFAAAASDWYWEMDSELRFSYFSDRFTEVSGVPAEKLLGKTRQQTGIPNCDPAAWEKHLDDLSNRRPFRDFVHPRTKSDGEVVWLSINGTPLFDSDGSFLGYRGTGSDVTVHKRAVNLMRDKEISEQMAQTKGQFLANMSHEIRTPINGVLGMTELLMKTTLTDRQRRFADNVRRSGELLLGVVNDILDFSKLEAGKMSLHCAPFDVRELVEDIVEMFAESAHGKGLEIAADTRFDMHTRYRGDPGRLRQVLTNLTANAVKFTNEGEVVVRVSCVDDSVESPQLRFEVSDTGIGIPEEARAHIFESFAQADGSTSRRYGGTGLGLAISSQLVGLMGGELGLRSVPEEGSTFWFGVQLAREEASSPAPDGGSGLAGASVLVVDDSNTNREILSHHLTGWGAAAECAAGGREALAQLRRASSRGKPYQLVVLDMHMPEMDGLAVANAMSREPGLAGVRRMMLSSICDSMDPVDLRSAGIETWLTKPVRQSQLYHCIASTLGDRVPDPVAPASDPGECDAPRFEARVLLAEDNAVNREVAIELLGPLGVTVDTADDGKQALDAWKANPYDLVFMDCQMPGLNGFDAVREIRRLETERTSASTPIIALTANAMEGDRERCIDAGMDDYLSKPFSERQLCEMLERWLPGGAVSTRSAVAPGAGSQESAAVHPMKSSPILDMAVIGRMRERERNGRKDVVRRIVGAWLDQSSAQLEALRDAVRAGDAERVHLLAHPLKSSSAQVGAVVFAGICADLEHAGRKRALDRIGERFASLERDYARVRQALELEVGRAAA